MTRTGVLSLAAEAHASSLGARWENDFVDALPYADTDLPAGWQDNANWLVAEEARPAPACNNMFQYYY